MNSSNALRILLVSLLLTTCALAGKAPSCPVVPAIRPAINACSSGHGCLDTSFNGTGLVLTNTDGAIPSTVDLDIVNAVFQQPNGSIVAVGTTTPTSMTRGVALVRYNPDGTIDTSFGSGGKTVFVPPQVGLDPPVVTASLQDPQGNFWAIADENGTPVLTRFTNSGALDTSFNSSGYVVISNILSRSLAMQADGKLLMTGYTYLPAGARHTTQQIVVARFNGDGTADTTFGSAGRVVLAAMSRANEVTFQTVNVAGVAQQDIVVAGESTSSNAYFTRLNPNGSIDSSFGSAGGASVTLCNLSQFFEVAIDGGGKWVAVGAVQGGTGTLLTLMRFTANGVLDTSFGNASTPGRTVVDVFGGNNNYSSIVFVNDATGTEQNLLLGGYSSNTTGGSYLGTLRFSPNGILDTTYGSNGATAADFGTANSSTFSNSTGTFQQQSDGRFIISGTDNTGQGYDFALARYLP